ncbi:MAG: hypothetical protein ACOCRX_01335 [Candidatus Woesearchaeota archaeon]
MKDKTLLKAYINYLKKENIVDEELGRKLSSTIHDFIDNKEYFKYDETTDRTKITFCEKCGEDVEYNVREEIKSRVVNGREVSYRGIDPFCNKCGDSVFVKEIRDYNLDMLFKAYYGKGD